MADSTPTTEATTQQFQVLEAIYHSPTTTTTSWTLREQIPIPPTATTPDNSTYLRDLREKLSGMQQQINEKLTLQMEEDKARQESTISNGTKRKIDEANEEDNYGEEVPEEDI